MSSAFTSTPATGVKVGDVFTFDCTFPDVTVERISDPLDGWLGFHAADGFTLFLKPTDTVRVLIPLNSESTQ